LLRSLKTSRKRRCGVGGRCKGLPGKREIKTSKKKGGLTGGGGCRKKTASKKREKPITNRGPITKVGKNEGGGDGMEKKGKVRTTNLMSLRDRLNGKSFISQEEIADESALCVEKLVKSYT